jgi:serpin B
VLKDSYTSELQSVNFVKTEKSRKLINSWVEQHTEKKIVEMIKPGFIDRLTRLVLVNAIYFKGDWENQFKESWTKNRPFYITENDSTMVPFMFLDKKLIFCKDSLCQVLELPYKGGELSMIVLLPTKRNDLKSLEKNLNSANFTRWTREGNEQKVKVFLPRFAMASNFLLRETLSAMGMDDAFSDKADFSGITSKEELYISEVIHKAYVKVDEKGSEAVAATAVVKRGLYLPEPPVVFRADHPFIFMIRDTYSGSILFIGRVIKPFE